MWRDEPSASRYPTCFFVSSFVIACSMARVFRVESDGYYVAYKPITLSSILFMFVEMKFIHCHSCVMFAMKSMSMCNDKVNYDEIII